MLDIKPVLQAAQAGGKVLKGYFGKNLEITQKTTVGDFRTQADLDSEKAVLDILGQAFPEYNLHGEESGLQDKGSEYTFFVDPLDGSNNFVLGIPYFSCSIRLMKGDQGIVGVVYNPMADQFFFCSSGARSKLKWPANSCE